MRTVFLLLIAVCAAGGCGSERAQPSQPFVPERDLTLQIQIPESQTEIASPVELGTRPVQQRVTHAARPQRRFRAVQPPVTLTAVQPAIWLTPVQPATPPTPTAEEPVNDRELPAGTTVTLIPASSGPSVGPEPAPDDPGVVRPGMRRGGGKCHGRGGRTPGIGIAAAPGSGS